MKSYLIPDGLLAAVVNLLERLPAQKDVRAVLNGLEACVTQQNEQEAAKNNPRPAGGGGPGPED